jgi:hypothetical protein
MEERLNIKYLGPGNYHNRINVGLLQGVSGRSMRQR